MPTPLTKEHITTVIENLPEQYRIMIRLLLIQYLDLTEADINYIVLDRPDPRMQQGGVPANRFLSKEALRDVTSRTEQYRSQVRQKRERLWLQIECTKKQMALSESLCRLAEELMSSRFEYSSDAMKDLKAAARSAVHRPLIRALEKKWDRDEMTEEDYRKERIAIEYQVWCRRLERERRRLDQTKRELNTVGGVPLQDHEIAHVWGIPFSSLAARKVKALYHYLQDLQAAVPSPTDPPPNPTQPPKDLWRETILTMTQCPVERSVGVYDGMEGSETALMDKLTTFATGHMTEDAESRFWQTVSRDYSPNAVEGQGKRQSLFSLQRLFAILSDIDLSPEHLETEFLAKISPTPKATEGQDQAAQEEVPQITDMAEHVIRSFRGEDRS